MEHSQTPAYAISIDTGGTFTDGFVSDGERTVQVKVDTTPHDLTVGFEACIEAAAAAVGCEPSTFLSSLTRIHFSSTIATNTIVEHRGARVGLIVTADAEQRIYGSDERAEALREFIDPELVRGVHEQVDAGGLVVDQPAESELERAVRELLELGVRLLVVSFANAHLNPANELRARELIDRSYPRHYLGAVPLMIASRVSLEADDFGRTACAVVNAYLHPSLVRALYRAEDRTRERGLSRPLLVVNSDGASSRVAKTRAIDTYDSGPSAGVLGAAYVASALGAENVCTFDVGGTTTDVACIAARQVQLDDRTTVGGVTIPHPSVSLTSFGIGGGSIIAVDDSGQLRVGPRSAGASPGPACFGLGASELTPTDVWLLLGYLEQGRFLGGRRRLDVAPAKAAANELAERLHTDPERALHEANAAIIRTLAAHLEDWAADHPALVSSDPDSRWLFSYGGGGGLLCVEAAEILGIPRVVVFPHSSVFSAFGGGLLPIAHSYQAAVPTDADGRAVAAILARMADNARRDLRAEGVVELEPVRASVTIGRHSHERSLATVLTAPDELVDGYEGRPGVVCRLRVSVRNEPRIDMPSAHTGPGDGDRREILTADGPMPVAVVAGLGDPSAGAAAGPAFLSAPDTTIFVPGGWSVRFTEQGYGVLSKEPEA